MGKFRLFSLSKERFERENEAFFSIFETDAKFVREKRSVDTLELLQKSLNDQAVVAVPQTKETPLSDGNPFSFDVTLQSDFSNFEDLSNFVIISCNQNCENP